jgi:hypothetical protein
VDPAQEGSGPGGRQLPGGPAGLEVGQQHMQPAQGPGALGDQVVAAVRQQPEDHGLVLEGDQAQLPVVDGGGGDRAGVGQVALAGAAGGQQPSSGGQGGRHVQDRLAGGDQELGDAAAQAVGPLHRPAPLRPSSRPGQQLGAGLAGGRQPLLAEPPAVGVKGGGGQGALVGVDADGNHWWPFVAAGRDDPATGSLTSGGHTPLSSHVTAGAGRSPARYQRANPQVARSLRARRPAPWTLRAADPGVLTGIQQVSSPVRETPRMRENRAVARRRRCFLAQVRP